MPASTSGGTFAPTRDLCAAATRALLAFPEEQLDLAIEEGERALAVGPILDPTLVRDAGPELRKHVAFLREVRRFRRTVEGIVGPRDGS